MKRFQHFAFGLFFFLLDDMATSQDDS